MARDDPPHRPHRWDGVERREGDDVSAPRAAPRYDNAISTGQLLIAVPLFVSAILYFGNSSWQGASNQKQLDQMRVDVTAQITGLKSEMTAQVASLRVDVAAQMTLLQASNDKAFNMVRSDIANIPGMKERVDQLDKRMDQADSRFDAQSRRLETIQQQSIQNSADIANMLRRQITK
jgi:hypothetical protein